MERSDTSVRSVGKSGPVGPGGNISHSPPPRPPPINPLDIQIFFLFSRIGYINVWNSGSVLTERLFCLSRTPVWKLSKHIFMGTWWKSGPVIISNSSQHQSASVQLAHLPAFRACYFPQPFDFSFISQCGGHCWAE